MRSITSRHCALAGFLAAALIAQPASAITFTFMENGQNLNLGTSKSFTEGGYTITASGFTTPGNAASELYSKFTSGDPTETGLGMVHDSGNDHEIDNAHFIQLNLGSLASSSSSSVWLGSVQSSESGIVWATKTAGSLVGATKLGTLTADGSLDITSWVQAGDYIDVTAGSQNVLITSLTANIPDGGTTALMLGAALSVIGLVQRKRLA